MIRSKEVCDHWTGKMVGAAQRHVDSLQKERFEAHLYRWHPLSSLLPLPTALAASWHWICCLKQGFPRGVFVRAMSSWVALLPRLMSPRSLGLLFAGFCGVRCQASVRLNGDRASDSLGCSHPHRAAHRKVRATRTPSILRTDMRSSPGGVGC